MTQQQQQFHHRLPQHSSGITSIKMLLIIVPCLFLTYQSCVVDGKPTSLIRGSNPTYSDEHHTASVLATEKVDVDDTSSKVIVKRSGPYLRLKDVLL